MLILSRKLNERIMIGDDIRISIVDIKGDQVKLGIDAPETVKVYRQEVYDAIQEENRNAAMSKGEPPAIDALFGGGPRRRDESKDTPDSPAGD